MKKVFSIIALTLFLRPHALCPDIQDFYCDAFVGVNYINDTKTEESSFHADPGFIVGTNIGYKVLDYLSFEGELAYRLNAYEVIASFLDWNIDFPLNGKLEYFSCMGNCIFEMRFVKTSLSSYLGAGLGESWIRDKLYERTIALSENVIGILKNQTDTCWCFCYQLIGGISYPLRHNFLLAFEYRYFQPLSFYLGGTHSMSFKAKKYF